MKRLLGLLMLGCAGLTLSPAPASAQFGRPFGVGGFGPMTPSVLPARNAFAFVPRYSWGTSYAVVGPPAIYGGLGASFTQRYTSVNNPRWAYAANYLNYTPYYSQTGSYMTASPNTRADLMMVEQRTLQNAQREAGLPGAKAEITGGWNYERGEPGPGPNPVGVAHAAPRPAGPVDRSLIMSGEALNSLLKNIVAAEAKGARGPSGYIPPLLWEELRFGGSPAGDLMNFARQAGNLELPAAFDDPALADARAEFEKDFTGLATAVQAGKAPEAAKVTKLEASFRRLQDGVAPVVKDLPFEDASAARRFLNRMAGALKALKAAPTDLLDPRWSTEGLTVADLTKHMARHKLQFDAALPGSGEAYTTMYQHLATYLAVLTQPKK